MIEFLIVTRYISTTELKCEVEDDVEAMLEMRTYLTLPYPNFIRVASSFPHVIFLKPMNTSEPVGLLGSTNLRLLFLSSSVIVVTNMQAF
jgi:hypothetical protein